LQFTRRILKYRSGYRDLFFYPLCWILGGVNSLYTFWGGVRHSLYKKDILKSKRLKAKVISVGNIVGGGTGKTPLVTYLAEGLTKRGHKVAVLTRGYHRVPKDQVIFKGEDSGLKWQEVGDEPFLLSRRFPDLVALSGIGNPLSFGTTLSRLELKVKEHVVFEDHHRFDLKDYRNLVNRARQLGAAALITTEKDAVKFSSFDKSEMPVYYVTVEVGFLQGEPFLWEAIEKVMKDGDRE
jgi:tetraacyldisaccharide-1-P 4'-kinase